MGVFIAWSEDRSKRFAARFQSWLPKVLPGLSRSDVHISLKFEAGDEWLTRLREALAVSEVGILCLTRENLAKPWLHFEAGAVSGSLGGQGTVIPLLIDDIDASAELPDALTHFQAASVSKKGDMWGLVKKVRSVAAPNVRVDEARPLFEQHWPKVESYVEEVNRVRPHAEHLVVYVPALKRNPFFTEVFEQFVRTVETLVRGAPGRAKAPPIHVRQSQLTGSQFINNAAQILEDVASTHPGAVVVMFPPTPAAFDTIGRLPSELSVNLILADLHPTKTQLDRLKNRDFFRKLVVVDNEHGVRLAAAAVARGPHPGGATAINAVVCEGDYHKRGRRFRAELNKLAKKKKLKVMWLDQPSKLKFAVAMEEAGRHVRRTLNASRADVRLRPTYIFCANDTMALGARTAVAAYCRDDHYPIRIISFDGSYAVRDLIDSRDPFVWCSVEQGYGDYAAALAEASLKILRRETVDRRTKTIKPSLRN